MFFVNLIAGYIVIRWCLHQVAAVLAGCCC
jgi:hypothetical protein